MKQWTNEEKRFLRDNYGVITDQEIADELGRYVGTIISKASKMNIKKYNVKKYAKENFK